MGRVRGIQVAVVEAREGRGGGGDGKRVEKGMGRMSLEVDRGEMVLRHYGGRTVDEGEAGTRSYRAAA